MHSSIIRGGDTVYGTGSPYVIRTGAGGADGNAGINGGGGSGGEQSASAISHSGGAVAIASCVITEYIQV